MRLLIFVFVIGISSVSSAQRYDVGGYWEIYKVESIEDNSVSTERNQFIEFMPSGNYVSGQIEGRNVDLRGQWKIDEAEGTIHLAQEQTEDSDHADDGFYKIELLNDATLKLTGARIIVFLERKK